MKTFFPRMMLIGLAGLAFQANAYERPVVENFLMLVAVSTAPMTVCPFGSYHPLDNKEDCKSMADGEKDRVYKPVSVRDHLENVCPGAILRSIDPAIYTIGTPPYQYVVDRFAVGYEPPYGGCRYTPKLPTTDDGSF